MCLLLDGYWAKTGAGLGLVVLNLIWRSTQRNNTCRLLLLFTQLSHLVHSLHLQIAHRQHLPNTYFFAPLLLQE